MTGFLASLASLLLCAAVSIALISHAITAATPH